MVLMRRSAVRAAAAPVLSVLACRFSTYSPEKSGFCSAVKSGSASGDGAANALDLPEVQQVMARVQPAEMLQALFPALNVHAYPF